MTFDEFIEKIRFQGYFSHRDFGVLNIDKIDIDLDSVKTTTGKSFSLSALYNLGLCKESKRPEEHNQKVKDTRETIEDSAKEEFVSPKLSSVSSTYTNCKMSYKELYDLMDEAAKKNNFAYSTSFWHFTNYVNAIDMLREGRMIGRSYNPKIRYDNRIKNETTQNVLSNNRSNRTTQYVRLYLRPQNSVFYNMKNNMKIGENDTELVIISIRRDFIEKCNQPCLLYYQNAFYADDYDLDWRYAINKKPSGFIIRNFNLYNFDNIYKHYDKNAPDEIKAQQCAECLVYKNLSTYFFEKIYFLSNFMKEKFLNELKGSVPDKIYYSIRSKCVVADQGGLFYNS